MTHEFFHSFDSIKLDMEFHGDKGDRACILFWPCMGGDFRMYKFPVRRFAEQGYSVVLFNPRGHGNSEGQMGIQTALRDLDCFRDRKGLAGMPLVGVGHSAGANALLQYASKNDCVARLFLVAPVSDSRRSLKYLYDKGRIGEFNTILAMRAGRSDVIDECLGSSDWMDPATWKDKGLREYMDSKSNQGLIGTFLENLFIPGHDSRLLLKKQAPMTDVIVGTRDNWYPLDETIGMAREYGCVLKKVQEAGEHFFTRAWPHVWDYILERLAHGLMARRDH